MKLLKKLKIVMFAAIFVSSIGFWADYAYEYTSVAVGRRMAMLVVWHLKEGRVYKTYLCDTLLSGPTARTVDTKPRSSCRFGKRIVEWLG